MHKKKCNKNNFAYEKQKTQLVISIANISQLPTCIKLRQPGHHIPSSARVCGQRTEEGISYPDNPTLHPKNKYNRSAVMPIPPKIQNNHQSRAFHINTVLLFLETKTERRRLGLSLSQKLTETVLCRIGLGDPVGEVWVEEVRVSHRPTHLLSDPHLAASLSCLALCPSPYRQWTTICSEFCHTR